MPSENNTTPATTEPAATAPGMPHEADIGSGEKTPGEHDTEEAIRSIPVLPKDGKQ